MAKRDWQNATRLCMAILKRDARYVDAHLALGLLAAEAGKPAMALRAFDTVLQIDPSRVDARIQRIRCLVHAGRHIDAEREADACRRQLDNDARLLDQLATVYSHIGKQEKAAPLYTRALELAPDNVAILSNAAAVRIFLGDNTLAQQYLERALVLEPDNCRSHWQLAKIRRAADRTHCATMAALADKTATDSRAQAYLHYALGKELEDLQQWPDAWRHYQQGAKAQRSRVTYDARAETAVFTALHERHNRHWFDSPPANSARDRNNIPVFILGLPRAGSTLVERIIGSHSQVQALGELAQWPLAVKRLSGVREPGLYRADIVRAATAIDPTQLARSYRQSLQHLRNSQPYFTDKLPNNFYYLGLLAKALPDARFVHIYRNPMDSCFAMYKQLFGHTYTFSYTQRELAEYFVQYTRLMAHWRDLLGDRLHGVNYDQLVTAQRPETERLLNHLQLPFEERCLAFHRTRGAAATASAAQVREPMHSQSVGRWRLFADELQEVRRVLEAEGISCD